MDDISAGVAEGLAQWAAEQPQVRRVWVFSGRSNGALDVALELSPVGDSEETLGVWMARSERWHAQLAKRMPCKVDLEWIDPDASSRPARARQGEAKRLVYERSD